MLYLLFALILAYLIGSIPTSYLIGRTRGIDVRKQGSGNIGATNVLRVVGKLPAVITLIVDISKGVIAVTVIALFFYRQNMPISLNGLKALLGLSAIVGHNWSIFLKFKGGKGVATSIGVLIILVPKAAVIGIGVFVITLLITKYVSLASIFLAVTVPIVAALTGREIGYVLLAVTLCILITYRHKDNIKRLLVGTENKMGKGKS